MCINAFRDNERFWILPLPFSAEGEVYTWGKGARGRLGRKEEDCGIPKALQLDESHPYVVTSVACFNGNSLLAVKRNVPLITLLLPFEQTPLGKCNLKSTNPQLKDGLNMRRDYFDNPASVSVPNRE